MPDTAPGGGRPIDVHAHLLPDDCYEVPSADGTAVIAEVDGRLVLDGFPIEVTREQLSSPRALVADMDRAGIWMRAIAPPPYAFAADAPADRAAVYAAAVNDGIDCACATAPRRIVGLGTVPLGDAELAAAELDRLLDMPAFVGITVPPIVAAGSFERDPLREIVRGAVRRDMAVLVHPLQMCAPGLDHHYLRNLLGNPFESAAGIAALLLDGLIEELPDMRIAFVHGGGCAPWLLGRWDHGWKARDDVRAGSTIRPSELFRRHVYVDLLTHDNLATRFLLERAGGGHVLLGSDYPWDMGDADPVGAALRAGADIGQLTANARRFLGLSARRDRSEATTGIEPV